MVFLIEEMRKLKLGDVVFYVQGQVLDPSLVVPEPLFFWLPQAALRGSPPCGFHTYCVFNVDWRKRKTKKREDKILSIWGRRCHEDENTQCNRERVPLNMVATSHEWFFKLQFKLVKMT